LRGDFKGNPLEKVRQVIADSELTAMEKYVVDWDGLAVPLDAKEYVTGLLYDGLNRVRKSILPEDVDVERKEMMPTYNRAGALEAITFDGTDYVRRIAYNAKGQRVLLAMGLPAGQVGNGIMTRYAYNDLNYRLQRIKSEKYTEASNTYTATGGTQQDLGYLYDLAGNIVGIRDKALATSGSSGAEGPGNLLKQFEYDPLNRLLSATGRESTQAVILPTWDVGVRNHDHTATNTYTRAYQFDKLGNVLQEQHTADGNASNSFTKTFNYHATQEHNRLLSFEIGSTTYDQTYDENGNLIADDTSRVYAWGYDDKLRYFSVVPGPSSSKYAHYLYDSSGTRVKKVVNKPSGIQEVTICIDGVFEECYVKQSGTINALKHWNTLHVLDGNSRLATIRVGTDVDDATPIVKYNLEDHLGNSSVMVDGTGLLVNREEYYPFGDTSFGAFAKKRYRYNGKEKDGESGLYNYGMRYYAPWMCRFVSVDPLAGEYPHYTPYQYAGNKPINFIDLDGLEETPPQTQTAGQGNDQPSLMEKAQSAFTDVIGQLKKGNEFSNFVAYELGLVTGAGEGLVDLLKLGWELSTIKQAYDIATGQKTNAQEISENIKQLFDLLSTSEGRESFIGGIKEFIGKEIDNATFENGAYEAGRSHGNLVFAIGLTLATGGAGSINALRTAMQGGTKAVAQFLRTGLGLNVERGVVKRAGQPLVEYVDDFARIVKQTGAPRPSKWPSIPEKMDEYLGISGKKIPDSPSTPGRGKTEWKPDADRKIIFEQRPYHPSAHEWHRGPQYHLDMPGLTPHTRFLPGEHFPPGF